MSEHVVDAADEGALIEAGRLVAEGLGPGAVVALNGPLGAGKTHFAKGIVAGLGSRDEVTSPTFSLVNEYRSGGIPVFHFDFYRLDSAEEVLRIGWDEYLDEEGVVLVEWADKFPEVLPEGAGIYDLDIGEGGNRIVKKR